MDERKTTSVRRSVAEAARWAAAAGRAGLGVSEWLRSLANRAAGAPPCDSCHGSGKCPACGGAGVKEG